MKTAVCFMLAILIGWASINLQGCTKEKIIVETDTLTIFEVDTVFVEPPGVATLIWIEATILAVDSGVVHIEGILQNTSQYMATDIIYRLSWDRYYFYPGGGWVLGGHGNSIHNFLPSNLTPNTNLNINDNYEAGWTIGGGTNTIRNVEIEFFWQ